MATYHEIPKPPQPKGVQDEYIKQIYTYLYKLADQLQAVINGLAALHEEGGNKSGNN